MRSLIILALFSALITSCSGKKKKGVDERTGLTDAEYEQMFAINQTLNDLDQAVTFSRPAAVPNDKVSKLTESLKSANCAHAGSAIPIEKYDANWSAAHSVGGVGCPIDMKSNWNYSANSLDRQWVVTKSFSTSNDTFKSEAGLASFGIHQGTVSVSRTSNGPKQEAEVNLTYNNFQMPAYGLIMANIKSQRMLYNGNKGSGTIVFNLRTRKDLTVKVELFITPTRPVRYRINGTQVDESVVEELFSAFKLNEIKARIDKMLY